MKQTTQKKWNNQGFSLIEIMIVLGLIGGIVAYIASRIADSGANAKVKTANLVIRNTMDQLEMYRDACGSYPTTAQGLKALVEKPSGEPACESWGPEAYSKSIPKDPWSRELVYESDGNDFEIISYGNDRRPGGDGADGDISSKKLDKR